MNTTSPLSSVSSGSNVLASGTTVKKSTSEESQDRFLKLLVAQLNNQDPMNPMDNAQMTSQMAQINTVTGIQQVNDTLKNMTDQFTAMHVLQGSSMVGHAVLVDSNALTLENGVAKGALDLAGRAESVKVEVMSPGGQVIDTVNLGALDTGRHNFTWDGANYNYSGNPTFKVTATLGGKPIETTSMAQAKVTSVGSHNGALSVQLQDRPAVAYSAIKAIL